MKNFILLINFLILFAYQANCQNVFKDKLEKFEDNLVIMFLRTDLDEMPLWSNDNSYLATNVQGDWIVFDLENAKFKSTKLTDGGKVGILKNLDIIYEVSDEEALAFKESTIYDMRELNLASGKNIKIESDIYNSKLIINNQTIVTLTGNCHSLSVSKDERYLAFLSELNGLIVLEL